MNYSDGLRICTRCRAYETTSPSGICSHCREQEMIDDAVPTPFDWSVWDDDEEEHDPHCAYCGVKNGIVHMHDTTWACSSCRREYDPDANDDLYYGEDSHD